MTQISQNSVIAGAATAAAKPVDPSLAKAAKAFEAIFMRQMIGAMRSSSLSDGLLDSSATDQFRDMADARTADDMAAGNHLGIANLLLKQLSPAVTLSPAVPNPDNAGAKS
ncbi:MAG: rod-binding protein [Sphingobium sp.]